VKRGRGSHFRVGLTPPLARHSSHVTRHSSVSGAAFAWPSNAGALIGCVVAQALLPVTKEDALHTSGTGKSACATPHAAPDRPCTRVPSGHFPI